MRDVADYVNERKREAENLSRVSQASGESEFVLTTTFAMFPNEITTLVCRLYCVCSVVPKVSKLLTGKYEPINAPHRRFVKQVHR